MRSTKVDVYLPASRSPILVSRCDQYQASAVYGDTGRVTVSGNLTMPDLVVDEYT